MPTSAVLLSSNSEITDSHVIEKVLEGDTDTYEILIRRYNTRLYRVAKGILSSEDEIEDVMQNTYLKAYEKLAQFRHQAQFPTWLTRILINEALASQKRSEKFSPLESKHVAHMKAQTYGSDFENKEKIAMRENAKNLLEKAIDNLPGKYRVIFMLREIEQLPVRNTASLLGISEENVKVRLHRAKSLLKNSLKESIQKLNLFEYLAPRCNKLTGRIMQSIQKLAQQKGKSPT